MSDLTDIIHRSINIDKDRGIRISAELEPLAGPRAPVKSAVYSNPHPRGEGDKKAFPLHDRPDPERPGETIRCSTLLSDEASRNLAERALLERLSDLRSIVIKQEPRKPDESDYDEVYELPADILTLPHSLSSTHLRMTDLEGKPFVASPLGKRLLKESGPFDAKGLYEHVPGFAISGYWHSNGQGRYPAQHPDSKVLASTRLPVVAFGVNEQQRGPGAVDPVVLGTAGLKLIGAKKEGRVYGNDGVARFEQGKAVEGTKLSNIGLGPIAPSMSASGWLTARHIVAQGMVSFDILRRLRFPDWSEDQSAAARTTLAMLVIAATVWSLDSLDLRSGCELTTVGSLGLSLVKRSGALETPLDGLEALEDDLRDADDRAQRLGIPSIFGEKISVIANADLIKAIKNGEKVSGEPNGGDQ